MAEAIKKKILLAEDDQVISNMYRVKLESDGFEVVVVDNGASALEQGTKEKFDIILLDVIMPRLDGFSVLGELRKNDKIKKTPIIMLTNLGTDEDIDKGKNLGANGYVVKSNLTPAQVVEEIKKFIK
jgi:DNA-binding response OmpR family regulator